MADSRWPMVDGQQQIPRRTSALCASVTPEVVTYRLRLGMKI
jgi:hypothetical protein